MVPRTEALLAEMAEHRTRFEAFCRSLSAEELARPVPDAPWTVFDYIAHLATIETLINPWMGAMAGVTGIPLPEIAPPQPFDLDDWNGEIVVRRRGRSLDDVFAEAAENRKRYADIVGRLTDEQLDTKVPFGGDRRVIDLPRVMVPLINLLTGIALHDVTHTQDILRALPERREDPLIADWLAGVDMTRVDPEMAARRA
jgi:hypothetical protein